LLPAGSPRIVGIVNITAHSADVIVADDPAPLQGPCPDETEQRCSMS
jgi:hypothetical protein